MTANLFLDPTQQPMPIPVQSQHHIQNLLQQTRKSYNRIYQITLENIHEGIVGIYTNNEGRYYRVSKQKVLEVNDKFSGATFSEAEKISKLNDLITEIIQQPDQFQLQVHASIDIPKEAVRGFFTESMSQSKMTLQDVLECHSRSPGVGFYVGVGVPLTSASN